MTHRASIGFAVRDVAGRGCAFAIDEKAPGALVFGASSPLRIRAAGVLPAHFVVLPHEGKLVAASASARAPAVLNGAPLPTEWTVLDVPSRVRVGAAAVDFFFIDGADASRGAPSARTRIARTTARRRSPSKIFRRWTALPMTTRVVLVSVALVVLFLMAR